MKKRTPYIVTFLVAVSLAVAVAGILYLPPGNTPGREAGLLGTALIRLLSAVAVLAAVCYRGYPLLWGADLPGVGNCRPVCREWRKNALPVALAFLVCLNNLPALALLSGAARVTAPAGTVLLFVLSCLAVAALEEALFRGLLLPLLLARMGRDRRGVFFAVLLSSALFGAVHFFNLAAGAALPAVLLQVGYSFLTGCMFAVLYLLGGGLLLPMVAHALYNFGGLLVPTLGAGTLWDTPTVVLTVALSLLAAAALSRALWRATDR